MGRASSSSSPTSSSSSSKRRSFDAVAARNTSLANASFRSLLVCHTGASCFAVLKKKELKSPAKASAVFLPRPPRLASLARSSLTRVAASSTSIAIALSRALALSHVPFRALGRAVGTSHAVGGFVPRLVPGALVDAPLSPIAAFASATPEDDDTVFDVVVVAAADALVTAADAASDAHCAASCRSSSLNSTSRLAWRSRKASHSARRRAFSSSATRSASSARARSRGGDVVAVAVESIRIRMSLNE